MHALEDLLIYIKFCLARTIEVACWIAIRPSSEHKKLLVAFSEVWGKTIEIEPKKKKKKKLIKTERTLLVFLAISLENHRDSA